MRLGDIKSRRHAKTIPPKHHTRTKKSKLKQKVKLNSSALVGINKLTFSTSTSFQLRNASQRRHFSSGKDFNVNEDDTDDIPQAGNNNNNHNKNSASSGFSQEIGNDDIPLEGNTDSKLTYMQQARLRQREQFHVFDNAKVRNREESLSAARRGDIHNENWYTIDRSNENERSQTHKAVPFFKKTAERLKQLELEDGNDDGLISSGHNIFQHAQAIDDCVFDNLLANTNTKGSIQPDGFDTTTTTTTNNNNNNNTKDPQESTSILSEDLAVQQQQEEQKRLLEEQQKAQQEHQERIKNLEVEFNKALQTTQNDAEYVATQFNKKLHRIRHTFQRTTTYQLLSLDDIDDVVRLMLFTGPDTIDNAKPFAGTASTTTTTRTTTGGYSSSPSSTNFTPNQNNLPFVTHIFKSQLEDCYAFINTKRVQQYEVETALGLQPTVDDINLNNNLNKNMTSPHDIRNKSILKPLQTTQATTTATPGTNGKQPQKDFRTITLDFGNQLNHNITTLFRKGHMRSVLLFIDLFSQFFNTVHWSQVLHIFTTTKNFVVGLETFKKYFLNNNNNPNQTVLIDQHVVDQLVTLYTKTHSPQFIMKFLYQIEQKSMISSVDALKVLFNTALMAPQDYNAKYALFHDIHSNDKSHVVGTTADQKGLLLNQVKFIQNHSISKSIIHPHLVQGVMSLYTQMFLRAQMLELVHNTTILPSLLNELMLHLSSTATTNQNSNQTSNNNNNNNGDDVDNTTTLLSSLIQYRNHRFKHLSNNNNNTSNNQQHVEVQNYHHYPIHTLLPQYWKHRIDNLIKQYPPGKAYYTAYQDVLKQYGITNTEQILLSSDRLIPHHTFTHRGGGIREFSALYGRYGLTAPVLGTIHGSFHGQGIADFKHVLAVLRSAVTLGRIDILHSFQQHKYKYTFRTSVPSVVFSNVLSNNDNISTIWGSKNNNIFQLLNQNVDKFGDVLPDKNNNPSISATTPKVNDNDDLWLENAFTSYNPYDYANITMNNKSLIPKHDLNHIVSQYYNQKNNNITSLSLIYGPALTNTYINLPLQSNYINTFQNGHNRAHFGHTVDYTQFKQMKTYLKELPLTYANIDTRAKGRVSADEKLGWPITLPKWSTRKRFSIINTPYGQALEGYVDDGYWDMVKTSMNLVRPLKRNAWDLAHIYRRLILADSHSLSLNNDLALKGGGGEKETEMSLDDPSTSSTFYINKQGHFTNAIFQTNSTTLNTQDYDIGRILKFCQPDPILLFSIQNYNNLYQTNPNFALKQDQVLRKLGNGENTSFTSLSRTFVDTHSSIYQTQHVPFDDFGNTYYDKAQQNTPQQFQGLVQFYRERPKIDIIPLIPADSTTSIMDRLNNNNHNNENNNKILNKHKDLIHLLHLYKSNQLTPKQHHRAMRLVAHRIIKSIRQFAAGDYNNDNNKQITSLNLTTPIFKNPQLLNSTLSNQLVNNNFTTFSHILKHTFDYLSNPETNPNRLIIEEKLSSTTVTTKQKDSDNTVKYRVVDTDKTIAAHPFFTTPLSTLLSIPLYKNKMFSFTSTLMSSGTKSSSLSDSKQGKSIDDLLNVVGNPHLYKLLQKTKQKQKYTRLTKDDTSDQNTNNNINEITTTSTNNTTSFDNYEDSPLNPISFKTKHLIPFQNTEPLSPDETGFFSYTLLGRTRRNAFRSYYKALLERHTQHLLTNNNSKNQTDGECPSSYSSSEESNQSTQSEADNMFIPRKSNDNDNNNNNIENDKARGRYKYVTTQHTISPLLLPYIIQPGVENDIQRNPEKQVLLQLLTSFSTTKLIATEKNEKLKISKKTGMKKLKNITEATINESHKIEYVPVPNIYKEISLFFPQLRRDMPQLEQIMNAARKEYLATLPKVTPPSIAVNNNPNNNNTNNNNSTNTTNNNTTNNQNDKQAQLSNLGSRNDVEAAITQGIAKLLKVNNNNNNNTQQKIKTREELELEKIQERLVNHLVNVNMVRPGIAITRRLFLSLLSKLSNREERYAKKVFVTYNKAILQASQDSLGTSKPITAQQRNAQRVDKDGVPYYQKKDNINNSSNTARNSYNNTNNKYNNTTPNSNNNKFNTNIAKSAHIEKAPFEGKNTYNTNNKTNTNTQFNSNTNNKYNTNTKHNTIQKSFKKISLDNDDTGFIGGHSDTNKTTIKSNQDDMNYSAMLDGLDPHADRKKLVQQIAQKLGTSSSSTSGKNHNNTKSTNKRGFQSTTVTRHPLADFEEELSHTKHKTNESKTHNNATNDDDGDDDNEVGLEQELAFDPSKYINTLMHGPLNEALDQWKANHLETQNEILQFLQNFKYIQHDEIAEEFSTAILPVVLQMAKPLKLHNSPQFVNAISLLASEIIIGSHFHHTTIDTMKKLKETDNIDSDGDEYDNNDNDNDNKNNKDINKNKTKKQQQKKNNYDDLTTLMNDTYLQSLNLPSIRPILQPTSDDDNYSKNFESSLQIQQQTAPAALHTKLLSLLASIRNITTGTPFEIQAQFYFTTQVANQFAQHGDLTATTIWTTFLAHTKQQCNKQLYETLKEQRLEANKYISSTSTTTQKNTKDNKKLSRFAGDGFNGDDNKAGSDGNNDRDDNNDTDGYPSDQDEFSIVSNLTQKFHKAKSVEELLDIQAAQSTQSINGGVGAGGAMSYGKNSIFSSAEMSSGGNQKFHLPRGFFPNALLSTKYATQVNLYYQALGDYKQKQQLLQQKMLLLKATADQTNDNTNTDNNNNDNDPLDVMFAGHDGVYIPTTLSDTFWPENIEKVNNLTTIFNLVKEHQTDNFITLNRANNKHSNTRDNTSTQESSYKKQKRSNSNDDDDSDDDEEETNTTKHKNTTITNKSLQQALRSFQTTLQTAESNAPFSQLMVSTTYIDSLYIIYKTIVNSNLTSFTPQLLNIISGNFSQCLQKQQQHKKRMLKITNKNQNIENNQNTNENVDSNMNITNNDNDNSIEVVNINRVIDVIDTNVSNIRSCYYLFWHLLSCAEQKQLQHTIGLDLGVLEKGVVDDTIDIDSNNNNNNNNTMNNSKNAFSTSNTTTKKTYINTKYTPALHASYEQLLNQPSIFNIAESFCYLFSTATKLSIVPKDVKDNLQQLETLQGGSGDADPDDDDDSSSSDDSSEHENHNINNNKKQEQHQQQLLTEYNKLDKALYHRDAMLNYTDDLIHDLIDLWTKNGQFEAILNNQANYEKDSVDNDNDNIDTNTKTFLYSDLLSFGKQAINPLGDNPQMQNFHSARQRMDQVSNDMTYTPTKQYGQLTLITPTPEVLAVMNSYIHQRIKQQHNLQDNIVTKNNNEIDEELVEDNGANNNNTNDDNNTTVIDDYTVYKQQLTLYTEVEQLLTLVNMNNITELQQLKPIQPKTNQNKNKSSPPPLINNTSTSSSPSRITLNTFNHLYRAAQCYIVGHSPSAIAYIEKLRQLKNDEVTTAFVQTFENAGTRLPINNNNTNSSLQQPNPQQQNIMSTYNNTLTTDYNHQMIDPYYKYDIKTGKHMYIPEGNYVMLPSNNIMHEIDFLFEGLQILSTRGPSLNAETGTKWSVTAENGEYNALQQELQHQYNVNDSVSLLQQPLSTYPLKLTLSAVPKIHTIKADDSKNKDSVNDNDNNNEKWFGSRLDLLTSSQQQQNNNKQEQQISTIQIKYDDVLSVDIETSHTIHDILHRIGLIKNILTLVQDKINNNIYNKNKQHELSLTSTQQEQYNIILNKIQNKLNKINYVTNLLTNKKHVQDYYQNTSYIINKVDEIAQHVIQHGEPAVSNPTTTTTTTTKSSNNNTFKIHYYDTTVDNNNNTSKDNKDQTRADPQQSERSSVCTMGYANYTNVLFSAYKTGIAQHSEQQIANNSNKVIDQQEQEQQKFDEQLFLLYPNRNLHQDEAKLVDEVMADLAML